MQFIINIFLHPMFPQPPRVKIIAGIFIIFVSSSICYSMLSNSLGSQWSLIDDHEIAYYLGGDQKITPSQAWYIYTHDTEIGKYGVYGRFRPAYHAFRLSESLVWNDELIFWYETNILIFTLFIFTLWYLLAEVIGLGIAGLVSVYVATSLYWLDVFARLGPSESYVVLGMTLAGAGMYLLYFSKFHGWGWFFLNLGLLICTGSKENCFPFLLPFGLIAWDQMKKGRINLFGRVLLGITCVWNTWILSAVFLAFSKTGKDVYQSSFFDKALSLLTLVNRLDVFILLVFCLFFFGIWVIYRKNWLDVSTPAYLAGGISIFLLLLYVTQCFIYTGDFPNGDRYDVPGLLVWPILFAVVLWFSQQLPVLKNNRLYKSIFLAIVFFISAMFTLPDFNNNIQAARKESMKHVRAERKVTRDLEKLASSANLRSDYAIIFQANHASEDYESIFSYNQFLRYYGVNNSMSILWAGDDISETDIFLYSLFHNLTVISEYGADALPDIPLKGDFVALPSLEPYGQKCILVVFEPAVPAKDCLIIFQTPH